MKKNQSLIIRSATVEEDLIVTQHFYQLWLDNDVAPDVIDDDWLSTTLDFLVKARQNLSFQAYVGIIDGEIVGSVSSLILSGLYPSPFKPRLRQ